MRRFLYNLMRIFLPFSSVFYSINYYYFFVNLFFPLTALETAAATIAILAAFKINSPNGIPFPVSFEAAL